MMSEIWSSDELIVNMGSFSDSGSEEGSLSLLSTWLSHGIQFDDNSTGFDYIIPDKYEVCEKPTEVYGTIGTYSDNFRSLYAEQSPNCAADSDGVPLTMETGQTNPEYNSVGSKADECSHLLDREAISYYWLKDQSRAISVSPSSFSCEQEDSHVRLHRNDDESFPAGFDGYPIVTAGAFHSCEDLMKNMISASSMTELSFSRLPVYNILKPNLIQGEEDAASNIHTVDTISTSKSGGDAYMCYTNQFPWANEREETYQMPKVPINEPGEDLHPPLKRHCNERLMADREKVNAVEDGINYMPMSSSSLMPTSITPTLSPSTVAAAYNTDGKTRARRGSATDPQSLYARQRRERINERLKVLQNLVPNGTKVDISTMLEEAIHYVKFLQLQIKILSSDDHWMRALVAFHSIDATFHIPTNLTP